MGDPRVQHPLDFAVGDSAFCLNHLVDMLDQLLFRAVHRQLSALTRKRSYSCYVVSMIQVFCFSFRWLHFLFA